MVLLVDDTRLIRDLVSGGLRARFPALEVLQAENLAQGYELVSNYLPGLVLLDIGLPDGSGLALAGRIRDELPGVVVGICTLHDDPELRQAAADSGAACFIVKHGELWSEIERLVRTVFGDPGSGPALPRRRVRPNALERFRESPGTGKV